MSYQILTIDHSEQLVIRNANQPDNAIVIADHRDLLLLRARLNIYLNTMEDDGSIATPPVAEDEMISASVAREEAAASGKPIEEATLRFAMTRGNIPGAEKRGGRWWVPRRAFDAWLKGHRPRK